MGGWATFYFTFSFISMSVHISMSAYMSVVNCTMFTNFFMPFKITSVVI